MLVVAAAAFADGSAGFLGEYLYSFSSGARQTGMGYTGTALPFDSGSAYFNPSSIARTVDKEAGVFYIPVLGGVSYSYFNVVYPITPGSVLGISRAALDVTGIDKTDVTGASTGTAFAGESCYFFTYGAVLTPDLSLGGSVKVLSQTLDVYSANAYGIDLGATYSLEPGIIAGAMLQNIIAPQLTLKNTAETFPVNLRLGITFLLAEENLIISGDISAMNLLANGADYSSGIRYSARWNTGIEYRLAKTFAIRAGANARELSAGFGYRTADFDIDYAVGFHEMGIKHMVGLKARFGLLPTEQEKWLMEKEKEVDMKIYIARAGKFLKNKNFTLAKEELNAALIIDEENKEVLDLLAEVKDAEIEDKAVTVMEEAFTAYEAGREEEGKKKLEEAKVLDPKIAEKLEYDYVNAVDLLLGERKYSEAKKLLNRVLFANPVNETAQDMLKQLLSVMELVK